MTLEMGFSKFFLALCFMGLTLTYVSLAQNSNQDFVDAHNAARAEVGVGPISWNKTLADYAHNYAKKRIPDCNIEHSMGPYSENIAGGWSGFTAIEAVKMWVDEKIYYDYKANSCTGGQECLHYTQIIWRDTVRLGCARARCDTGGVFVTCNYDPPGNNEGERPY